MKLVSRVPSLIWPHVYSCLPHIAHRIEEKNGKFEFEFEFEFIIDLILDRSFDLITKKKKI